MVKHLKHAKTGVIFVATPSLMKRSDMIPVHEYEHEEAEAQVTTDADTENTETLTDDETDPTQSDIDAGDDDDNLDAGNGETFGNWYDGLDKEQLIARGKDYNLSLTRNMNEATMIARIEQVMEQ